MNVVPQQCSKSVCQALLLGRVDGGICVHRAVQPLPPISSSVCQIIKVTNTFWSGEKNVHEQIRELRLLLELIFVEFPHLAHLREGALPISSRTYLHSNVVDLVVFMRLYLRTLLCSLVPQLDLERVPFIRRRTPVRLNGIEVGVLGEISHVQTVHSIGVLVAEKNLGTLSLKAGIELVKRTSTVQLKNPSGGVPGVVSLINLWIRVAVRSWIS